MCRVADGRGRAGVAWAPARGCRGRAGDALLDNVVVHRAHEAHGFEEAERAVRYRRAP